MSVFTGEYAKQYDLLYDDKDYRSECDLLENIFHDHGCHVRRILDLGCGTGAHALELAVRGYHVTGVDRSREMLARASTKATAAFGEDSAAYLRFVEADLHGLQLGELFDAALMMFAVMGYQCRNEDVVSSLETVRRHLAPDGLFVADFWYGPAVLAMRPGDRIKVMTHGQARVIRVASAALDTYRHIAEVQYHVWTLQGERVTGERSEVHRVRYFFPQELPLFLAQAGLELLAMRAVDDARIPDETSWNAAIIARAV